MKKIIITFVALIIGLICRAQTIDEHYYFKSLSSQNGLSQNTVSAILQDSKGFMWFGTKDGLDRYDGVSFRHFKYDRTNPRSLGNNFVTSTHCAKPHGAWQKLEDQEHRQRERYRVHHRADVYG